MAEATDASEVMEAEVVVTTGIAKVRPTLANLLRLLGFCIIGGIVGAWQYTFIHLSNGTLEMIGNEMFGLPTALSNEYLVAGYVGHTLFSVVSAIFFGFIMLLPLKSLLKWDFKRPLNALLGVGWGAIFGVILYFFGPILFVPAWLQAVGAPGAPPIGGLLVIDPFGTANLLNFWGHLIFGTMVASTIIYLYRRT